MEEACSANRWHPISVPNGALTPDSIIMKKHSRENPEVILWQYTGLVMQILSKTACNDKEIPL
jgi:hypothetical protein